jgi:ankyrin repeat protein
VDVLDAIKAQDAEQARSALRENPEQSEARDENGVSALMLSYYYGVPVGDELRQARTTPLDVFEAATVGDVARLRELLDEDPLMVHELSADQTTALHFAAFFAQPDTVRLLLERGADVHAVSPTFGNVTPLHSAAAAKSPEIVHALLDEGADPNARQTGGFRALHAAAQNGDVAMARDLLANGADPSATTDDGRTALSIAEQEGHDEVAALLRESGY